MYSVAFTFEAGTYDARFHELNARIDAAARATPGYLGVESWRSADGARANATYYWQSLEALRAFSDHPDHLAAKRDYRRWYRGYHIVIAEIVRSYGDGNLPHIGADERAARRAPLEPAAPTPEPGP
jgi:heme-degrading monooxygenase HmoA